MLVIVAVLLIGGGIATFLAPRSLLPTAAIGIVALGMIAVPFALNLSRRPPRPPTGS